MPRNTNRPIAEAVSRIFPWRLAALGLLMVGLAHPAQAQFGGLKKLKNALSHPDSAVPATDSSGHPVVSAADSTRSKRSFLSRAVSAASSASDRLEKTTGISAKDAALAASGVGVMGLVAKKAGLPDPGSVVGNAVKNAAGNSLRKATGAGGIGVTDPLASSVSEGLGRKTSVTDALGALQSGAMRTEPLLGAALSSAGVGTAADAAAMLAFQQVMMQTAMAASSGDAAARARLEAWQALALKYQADASRLTMAAAGGDTGAALRLQAMQLKMIKEWTGAQNLHTAKTKP